MHKYNVWQISFQGTLNTSFAVFQFLSTKLFFLVKIISANCNSCLILNSFSTSLCKVREEKKRKKSLKKYSIFSIANTEQWKIIGVS